MIDQLGGKWVQEAGVTLSGDLDTARRYIGVGLLLLGQLRDRQIHGGVESLTIRKIMPDGSVVDASLVMDTAKMAIFGVAGGVTEKPEPVFLCQPHESPTSGWQGTTPVNAITFGKNRYAFISPQGAQEYLPGATWTTPDRGEVATHQYAYTRSDGGDGLGGEGASANIANIGVGYPSFTTFGYVRFVEPGGAIVSFLDDYFTINGVKTNFAPTDYVLGSARIRRPDGTYATIIIASGTLLENVISGFGTVYYVKQFHIYEHTEAGEFTLITTHTFDQQVVTGTYNRFTFTPRLRQIFIFNSDATKAVSAFATTITVCNTSGTGCTESGSILGLVEVLFSFNEAGDIVADVDVVTVNNTYATGADFGVYENSTDPRAGFATFWSMDYWGKFGYIDDKLSVLLQDFVAGPKVMSFNGSEYDTAFQFDVSPDWGGAEILWCDHRAKVYIWANEDSAFPGGGYTIYGNFGSSVTETLQTYVEGDFDKSYTSACASGSSCAVATVDGVEYVLVSLTIVTDVFDWASETFSTETTRVNRVYYSNHQSYKDFNALGAASYPNGVALYPVTVIDTGTASGYK